MLKRNFVGLSILIIVMLGLCAGMRVKISRLPLAYGARSSELQDMVVDMSQDSLLDRSFLQTIKNDRKPEKLKKIYEDISELLVVQIMDDPINYNEWSSCRAKVCRVVRSKEGLRAGEEFTLVTENVYQISNDMKSDYCYGNFFAPLQRGKRYLMPLTNYTHGVDSMMKIARERGISLPVRYTNFDGGWYSQIALEENLKVKAVQKGKRYRMKDLLDYETYTFDLQVAQEWKKTRLKILEYYLYGG